MDVIEALELMTQLKDEGVLKQRLDEYIKLRKQAEDAADRLAKTNAEHAATKQEMEGFVAAKKNELAAAQHEHDKAAKEAADRIALGHRQAEELLRIRSENDARSSELDRREAALGKRESELQKNLAEHARRAADTASLRDELSAKLQRLQDAMAA